MNYYLIYIIIAAGLFTAAFITKRRFGLLGLALAAGSILSEIWGNTLTMLAPGFLNLSASSLLSAVVLSLAIVLPAVLLMLHGDTYKTTPGRVIGAGMFMILAMAFLIEPLGQVFMLHGVEIYDQLVSYKAFIVGIGLIVAIVDLFFASFQSKGASSKK